MSNTDQAQHIEPDRSPVTKRDLVEQNFPKVFPQPPRGDIIGGAFVPDNLAVMIDFAKAMATARQIGAHLQGNVGDCLFIVSKAIHHKLEPYSLAMMSYEVNGRIQFEAKFATALLHSSGLLRQRLRYIYTGEGEERSCSCVGHFRNEEESLAYISPPLRQITPKKSPLWSTDPDQQLAYYSARAWARRYASDVIAGFHFEGDEDHLTIDNVPAAVSPSEALRKRLQAAAGTGEGFNAAQIEKTIQSAELLPYQTDAAAPASLADALAQSAGSAIAGKAGKRTGDRPAKDAEPSKASKPFEGTTVAAYRRHVAEWLLAYQTEQAIEERWRSENKIRNQCGVTAARRERIRTLVDQRIAELRTS